MIQFKKREIVFIFVMFVAVATLVFSMGIYIGGIFVSHEFKSSALKKENPQLSQLTLKTESSVSSIENGENNPVNVETTETKPLPELLGFTIQVSAVEDRQMAWMEVERLKGLGFPTVSIEKALMENRKWFFVNLGYFQNEKKAFTLASRLRKKGILSSFLIRKSESQVHEED